MQAFPHDLFQTLTHFVLHKCCFDQPRYQLTRHYSLFFGISDTGLLTQLSPEAHFHVDSMLHFFPFLPHFKTNSFFLFFDVFFWAGLSLSVTCFEDDGSATGNGSHETWLQSSCFLFRSIVFFDLDCTSVGKLWLEKKINLIIGFWIDDVNNCFWNQRLRTRALTTIIVSRLLQDSHTLITYKFCVRVIQ